jgi:hypothetical protein
MSSFLPLTIRFRHGYPQTVSSISDAAKALNAEWPNKHGASYKEAVRLVAAGQAGTCKPYVAFAAFAKAALDQGLLKPMRRSAELRRLDQLTDSLF